MMRLEKRLDLLPLLSKSRSILFGLSIFLIVVFHSTYSPAFKLFAFAKEFLHIGVDIFIFLSGFGIYKSLQKNSLYTYIKNRLKRLLIPYFPFILIWISFISLQRGFSLSSALGNLTLIGWFAGQNNQFNWYVQGLLALYLLSPILKALVDRSVTMEIALLITAFFVSFNYFHSDQLLLFSRLPIYIFGMIFSKQHKQVKSFHFSHILLQ